MPAYRGADRRSRHAGLPHALPLRRIAWHAAVIPLAAFIPLAPVFVRGLNPVAVGNVLEMMAALVAVVAGGAMLVCWRIGGHVRPGLIGVGLVDFGLLSVAYYSIGLIRFGQVAPVEPYGRVVICVVAAAAVLSALRSPEVDSGFRPLHMLVASALIGLLALGVLQRAVSGGHMALGGTAMQAGTGATCAAVWLAVAAYSVVERGRWGFTRTWVVTFVLVLAASRAASAALASYAWTIVGYQAAFLLASSIALAAALWELRCTVLSQDHHALGLRTVLDDLRAKIHLERVELDERLHDLRNAVAAVHSADVALRLFEGQLDETTRADLAEAISSELARLQTLIEPGRHLRSDDFTLDSALAPLISTERARGTDIDARLGHVAVRGDREAVAQVLQNLLANARKYAPGSAVVLSAQELPDRVVLRVRDHGPGIPVGERLSVFARGCRGSTSHGIAGSGVGLYVASRLMADMGGSLRLEDTELGSCFVMELPRPTVPSPVPDLADQAAVGPASSHIWLAPPLAIPAEMT